MALHATLLIGATVACSTPSTVQGFNSGSPHFGWLALQCTFHHMSHTTYQAPQRVTQALVRQVPHSLLLGNQWSTRSV